MRKFRTVTSLAATLLMTAMAFSQGEGPGQGQAVITVLPARDKEAAPNLTQQDLSIKVNGKETSITNWIPMRGANDKLELVVLIDGSARTSLGTQMSEISKFISSLPPNAKVAIAYMDNGNSQFTGPLSTDHAAVLKGLHLPGGIAGGNASPYFCLSDLAKRWPSNDRAARREVVVIGDGVDRYNPRYDPEDPYVQAAIADSVRAGLIIYSIYWRDQGRLSATGYENNAGQNLMLQVTQATGGNSYWEGMGNPVSFQPYFQDLDRRLQNQYELSFTAPLKGKPEVASLKLKVSGISGKVDAPEKVYLSHSLNE